MTVGRELMAETATTTPIGDELRARFPGEAFPEQTTRDGIPTFWVSRDALPATLRFLKSEVPRPYPMLWDLTAIDERERRNREGQPPSDFTTSLPPVGHANAMAYSVLPFVVKRISSPVNGFVSVSLNEPATTWVGPSPNVLYGRVP